MHRDILPATFSFRFRTRLRTRWSDEDNHGVLNNAVYLTLLEEARLAYFRQLELMQPGQRFPFVLARTDLGFLHPGHGGTNVVVELATTSLGNSSLTQLCRISQLEGSQVWAEAQTVLVSWDHEHGRTRPWSFEFRKSVLGYEGLDAQRA